MDTSSDSDGVRSPGVYGQVAYTAAMTGYDSPAATKSLSRHSESSGSGGSVDDEPCAKAHHKFSIDRILGLFSGGNPATATAIDSCVPETSDPGKSHRNESALQGAGESSVNLYNDIIEESREFYNLY